jgi:hypothetical protein
VPRDEIPGAHTEEVKREKPKQADMLIALAEDGELFHAPDGAGFADLPINGHRETWAIRSKGFRRWLTRRFFEVTGGAASSEAFQSALAVIEAKALFDGAEHPVQVRVAGLGGKIYIDLADSEWRVIEVDPHGWRLLTDPPVRFRRPTGMLPLPVPRPGGSINQLRTLVNVADERDFVAVVGWLLAALSPHGPYPVLVLSGEQGSAKSFMAALLRGLVDPNIAPLRSLPREDRDLFIAANNAHCIVFDNVSSLPQWLSDALCRIATGGGFATRQLYTDGDEALFDAKRPIVLNGIEDFVTRADLGDRGVFLRLEPIGEHRRRPEKEIWGAFEAVRPQIFGTLLDALAHGLRELPNTRLDCMPRMADFAIWVAACEGALWPVGTFSKAYHQNRAEANETIIASDAVALAVRSLMQKQRIWEGFVAELLPMLAEEAGPIQTRSKSWPTSPGALSGRLRRAAPNLRRSSINIIFGKHRAKGTPITIEADEGGAQPSGSSSKSAAAELDDFRGDDRIIGPIFKPQTVRGDPRNSAMHDADDGRDGRAPTLAGDEEAEWKF